MIIIITYTLCTIAMYIFIPVRKTFIMLVYIYIEHRNLETRKVQVRNFLLPLSLKVLRHKEGDTHSFYSGFSICPPHHHHHLVRTHRKASASKRKSTIF